MTSIKTIALVIAGVIVGLLISAVAIVSKPDVVKVGGPYENVIQYFSEGVNIGKPNATTTSNLNFFCLQVNPTSTQTTMKITATTTATPAQLLAGVSPFYASYGTCP